MLKRLLGISVILVLLAACSNAGENHASTPVVIIKEIVVTATPTTVSTPIPTPKPIPRPTKTPSTIQTSTPTATPNIAATVEAQLKIMLTAIPPISPVPTSTP